MTALLREFFSDLKLFFSGLAVIFNGRMAHDLVGQLRDIRRDSYSKIPLILTVTIHLLALILSIATPYLLSTRNTRIPEIYTVNLYNVEEAAPPPPPQVKVVKVAVPTPQKTAVQETLNKEVVSLSPIRQKLAEEQRKKEAIKRRQEIRDLEVEQVRLDLLKDQAASESAQADEDLAKAKREAAAKIAEFYRKSAEAKSISSTAANLTGYSPENSGGSGIDQQKLEALDRYRARLFSHISPFWQLPELQGWDENLRAVIVMQVNRDGTVLSSHFEKRSENLRFNQYAQKAIDNAQPLPPFPLDFLEKTEEIAVTFSPGGLL